MNTKRNSQGGFTLLELLVVVAILAAIAGTATIALKDTDARASAAAHVTMMDELNKGISTYRVLKRNELPTRFDSLLTKTGGDPGFLGFSLGTVDDPATTDVDEGTTGDAAIALIPTGVQEILNAGGITALMYVDTTLTAAQTGFDLPCSNIQALINSRKNNVVAGNVFLPPVANGCGDAVNIPADGSASNLYGVWWIEGSLRLTGQPDADDSAYDADGNNAYLLTGIGPASTLFDTNSLGGMTTVPVYRHVKPDEYSRFIAVWNVGTYQSGAIVAGDQVDLVTILDGALDTKEEELGEWDGTRNTI